MVAAICMSMMTDRPRIRAVLGDPMSDAEARAHVEQAVDIFLHGCVGAPAAAAIADGRPPKRKRR